MYRYFNKYKTLKEQVDRDGYAVVKDLFTPIECDELLIAGYEVARNMPDKEERVTFSAYDRVRKRVSEKYLMESNDNCRVFFEEDVLDEDGNLLVNEKYAINKIGHALHWRHPVFRFYTYCHRVKVLVHSLQFREPAVVQSMFKFKHGKTGSKVPPHQDSTYLYAEPTPVMRFWIALDDATVENSCIWVIKGSHKSGVQRRLIRNPDQSSKNLLIYDKNAPFYPNFKFTPVEVRKGSCLVLHGNLIQKSFRNFSDWGRPAYAFHVLEKQNNTFSTDNWLLESPNAPFANMYNTGQVVKSTKFK